MATSPGKIWSPIWGDTVWNSAIWAQPSGSPGVSPGRMWKPIWKAIWGPIWATEDPIPTVMIPDDVVGNFGWLLTGGSDAAALLADGLDATYIGATEAGSVIQFTLSAPPSFSEITGCSVTLRTRTA